MTAFLSRMQNLVKIGEELWALSFHNAVIETEICTSVKSDLYFRSHLPLSTKSALLNFNSNLTLTLTLILTLV